MFRFIEKLQKRPENERRAIALSVSGGITFVIAVLWLMSVSFSSPSREEKRDNPGPFGSFSKQISAGVNNAFEAIHDLKSMFNFKPETFVAE